MASKDSSLSGTSSITRPTASHLSHREALRVSYKDTANSISRAPECLLQIGCRSSNDTGNLLSRIPELKRSSLLQPTRSSISHKLALEASIGVITDENDPFWEKRGGKADSYRGKTFTKSIETNPYAPTQACSQKKRDRVLSGKDKIAAQVASINAKYAASKTKNTRKQTSNESDATSSVTTAFAENKESYVPHPTSPCTSPFPTPRSDLALDPSCPTPGDRSASSSENPLESEAVSHPSLSHISHAVQPASIPTNAPSTRRQSMLPTPVRRHAELLRVSDNARVRAESEPDSDSHTGICPRDTTQSTSRSATPPTAQTCTPRTSPSPSPAPSPVPVAASPAPLHSLVTTAFPPTPPPAVAPWSPYQPASIASSPPSTPHATTHESTPNSAGHIDAASVVPFLAPHTLSADTPKSGTKSCTGTMSTPITASKRLSLRKQKAADDDKYFVQANSKRG